MSIRIWADPRRHRYGGAWVADIRVNVTACGIRFAWGHVPRRTGGSPNCDRCWS